MALEAIIAVNKRGYIGKDDVMLWNDKEDLRRFKELTLGRAVIVGRKTADKLPPLPGRRVIVVSRNHSMLGGVGSFNKETNEVEQYIENVESLEKAIERYPDAMIMGGAQIYEQAAPFIKRWHITLVDDDQVGDTRADFLSPIFTFPKD